MKKLADSSAVSPSLKKGSCCKVHRLNSISKFWEYHPLLIGGKGLLQTTGTVPMIDCLRLAYTSNKDHDSDLKTVFFLSRKLGLT